MTHRAASYALLKGVNVVGVVPSSHEGVLWGAGVWVHTESRCTVVVNYLLYALVDPH